MALLYSFNFDSGIFLFNILYSLLILLGFVIIFVFPAYIVQRIVEIIKKRYSKNQLPKKSISMFIFYGCISNLVLTLFLTSVGLLNKSWVIYTLASFLVIGVIFVDLIEMKLNFKEYFQMWKNRFIKLKTKIKNSFTWMSIASICVGILIILSSFFLPLPVGEDMIGHSFFIQLIYEQSKLFPELSDRIAPLIITSNVVQYPLFAHYIAVLNYSFVVPITNFTGAEFLNIYMKIWMLILPFTIKEVCSKIFCEKVSRIAFIMAYIFSPAYFVLWRWGGFAYLVGLIFLSITIYIYLSWKDYHIIEYILLSLLSTVFILMSHTVVFTFAILVYLSGAFYFIYLKITKKDNLIKANSKPFYLSLFISVGFICCMILLAVSSTLLKYRTRLNENPYPYNLYLGMIGLLGTILFSISSYFLFRKRKEEKEKKHSGYLFIQFYFSIILILSSIIVAILFNPEVNGKLKSIALVRTLLLGRNSTTPILDFSFIGLTDPLINTGSNFLTILIQIFANFYINGFLAIIGVVLLFVNLKKKQDNNLSIKLFVALVTIMLCFLVYYGLSLIDVFSFLAFKFPIAFFIIRYERLFLTFMICIAPILSAYVINSYLSRLEEASLSEDVDERVGFKKFKKQFRNFFINNKKGINYAAVIIVTSITIGTYVYVGVFRTTLTYSNDFNEATQWIIENTNVNDKFIVDTYGSWITFTTNRQVSFAFLVGSTDQHLAISITVRIIYDLICSTATEMIYLDQLGYHYIYLSIEQPNKILELFYNYNGYYYTFETFENLPYVDVVFKGESDMILYLNTSSFTHEVFLPVPPGRPSQQNFLLVQRFP